MRRMQVGLVLVLALVFVAGCSVTMKRWERVGVGMEPPQVKELLGRPAAVDAGDSGTGLRGVWTYYDSTRETRYEIVFDKGKVVEKHAMTCRSW